MVQAYKEQDYHSAECLISDAGAPIRIDIDKETQLDTKMTRRQLLHSAAALGSVVVVGSVGANAEIQPKKAANARKPLLFGAGMIWAFWLNRDKDYDLRQMDALRSIGGRLTSVTFDWTDREKERGKWDWSYPDHAVDAAQKRGLKQFGYIGNTPGWALPEGVKPELGYRFPPREEYEKDFRAYCRKVAERYKGRVEMFQFWNEPNGCSWINDGCSNGHMFESYTKWLKIAYESLKEGNPKCTVCAGALDYHEGVKEGYKYIQVMYDCGAKGHFDAISIHPYGEPLHWNALRDTYAVMKKNGDGDKGLWITEWGWSNSKGEEPARKLKEVLTKLLSPEYSYVTLCNYLCVTDLPIENTEQYGLFDRELKPRPIAKAFKEVARRRA